MNKFEEPQEGDKKVAFPKEHADGRVLSPDEAKEEHDRRLDEDAWREQR